MDQVKWNTLYYGFLVGAKVTGVKSAKDELGDVWTKLTVEKDGAEFEIEISSDEEGNAPGFLFGLPSVVLEGDELVRLDGGVS